jgi:hypothetical protein
MMDFLEIFRELFLIYQKKDLLLRLVDWHVKTAVHSIDILQHNRGQMQDFIPSSTSLNDIFQRLLDSYKKCMLKAFSTDTKQLIKGRIHYLKERFVVTENRFPLATCVLGTSSRPSETDEFLEFGNSKYKPWTFI